jgi:predicted nucleotidyltransferase
VRELVVALQELRSDLDEIGARWALIGGLAVSVQSEPRTTRDIDVAVFVADDDQAEGLIRGLVNQGYRFREEGILEHQAADRLATVRLDGPEKRSFGVVVDLMFASSGIELEIVRDAQEAEVFPGLKVPVASRGHLIAMKILAGRLRDQADVERLLEFVDHSDLEVARESLRLIEERGYSRGDGLIKTLESWLERS